MVGAALSGTSTQDLATGGAGGEFFGAESADDAGVAAARIVSKSVINFGDGFEAGKG